MAALRGTAIVRYLCDCTCATGRGAPSVRTTSTQLCSSSDQPPRPTPPVRAPYGSRRTLLRHYATMTHHEHGNGVPRDDLRIALENGSSESAIRPPVATAPGLSNVALPSALPSFYKRPLPASCIAFDSAEGKGLFRTGLLEGYMAKYFSLAQSFLTQNEVSSIILPKAFFVD